MNTIVEQVKEALRDKGLIRDGANVWRDRYKPITVEFRPQEQSFKATWREGKSVDTTFFDFAGYDALKSCGQLVTLVEWVSFYQGRKTDEGMRQAA